MSRNTYYHRYDVILWIIGVAITLVGLFFGVARGVFADQRTAVRTMEAQGYSHIQIVDHAWFAVGLRGCDSNDAARFTVRAMNSVGEPVKVFVCTGAFFKGGTIRVE